MGKSCNGWVICLCFVLSIVILAMAAISLGRWCLPSDEQTSSHASLLSMPTIVIDAGHGGEDAGASSASGIGEKDINLAVALILRDMLEANGIPTVMTRTQDVLLYDRGGNYQGHKKALDLAVRRSIADATQNAILVSIHMNAFPDSRYSGLQVWYQECHPQSKALADAIQENAKRIDPQNHRKTKEAGDNIYLLYHTECPAVLVECGFLSNIAEAEKLSNQDYQKSLALVIFDAICRTMTES